MKLQKLKKVKFKKNKRSFDVKYHKDNNTIIKYAKIAFSDLQMILSRRSDSSS